MEGLGINLGYLIVQILNFAIIFVVINAWVVKPITNMLKKRRQSIEKGLEDARVASEARANAEVEAGKIVNEAQQKSAEILREATERAETAAQKLRADAEAEAVTARETNQQENEHERNRILQELRGQVGALAIAAAQKLIGDALSQDKERQLALVNEFFSGIKEGEVVVLERLDLDSSAVEVTSALPLTENEKEKIKDQILADAEGKRLEPAAIEFRVDPSILGGLVVRVGDRIVDGSVAAQLQDMSSSL